MNRITFQELPHEQTGTGVASITEIFTGLHFSNENLHVGLMHTDYKPLINHAAIFSPSFSRTKYLSFDVRTLLGVKSAQIPLKGGERLGFIVDELEKKFDDDNGLLLSIIGTKTSLSYR